MRRVEQAHLSSMTVHTADGDLFLDQSTPASFLARRRAGQTQDVWERQHFFDQARRLLHRAFGNQLQVARNIDVRWAVDLARRLAVGVVV